MHSADCSFHSIGSVDRSSLSGRDDSLVLPSAFEAERGATSAVETTADHNQPRTFDLNDGSCPPKLDRRMSGGRSRSCCWDESWTLKTCAIADCCGD